MHKKDLLLLCMVFSYIIAIIYCYRKYSCSYSVSNMICGNNCNNIVLASMIFMGIFTILYEIARNDNISLACIVSLLIGIYGVIKIDETNNTHYVFAAVVFLSIICFMINHYYVTACDILYFLLFLQILFLCFTIINITSYSLFIYGEILFILNFAVFYLYLHYKTRKDKRKKKRQK